MGYVVLAVLLLGTLIVLHEAGHYWAAVRCGIKVQEFSAGMGPQILKRTGKNGTLFSVRMLPIGGYCQFYGEDTEQKDPRAFNNQPILKRFCTVICGPLANILTAVIVIILYLSLLGAPALVPVAGSVEEHAMQAGMQVGDRILAVNGETVGTAEAIASAITESDGQPVSLLIERKGTELPLQIQPFFDGELNRWRLGFSFGQERRRISLLESIPFSIRYNWESAGLILKTLGDLLFHGRGAEDVTGPVGTVYVIQQVTRQGGIDVFLELAALISINLGIFNLLPIPGLDGSRLIFLMAEAAMRRPVKRELEGAIHMIGFAILMGLMILLTTRDVWQILR